MTDRSLELYKSLYLIRQAEEAIIRLYPEDDMKTPMHMSMGQEAVSVGVCHALGESGQIFTSYRSHAAFLAKSDDVERFFAELFGKQTGTAQGRAGSMHLAAPERGHLLSSAIVASTIPVAVGAAFANRQAGNGRIACVFFGDGAMDEGVFWESLNAAAAMRVPVLFVAEDNGIAVHAPVVGRQGFRSITKIVEQFECEVFDAETTDVEEVHRLAQAAIDAINATGGPAFLRLRCYRYLEHVGTAEDFDAGYRPIEEYRRWKAKDPVLLQRQRLLNNGISEAELQTIEQEVRRRTDLSIEAAKTAPTVATGSLTVGVFHEND